MHWIASECAQATLSISKTAPLRSAVQRVARGLLAAVAPAPAAAPAAPVVAALLLIIRRRALRRSLLWLAPHVLRGTRATKALSAPLRAVVAGARQGSHLHGDLVRLEGRVAASVQEVRLALVELVLQPQRRPARRKRTSN